MDLVRRKIKKLDNVTSAALRRRPNEDKIEELLELYQDASESLFEKRSEISKRKKYY